MTDDPDSDGSKPVPAPFDAKAARDARLAAALRANLRRRKDRGRAQAAATKAGPGEDGPGEDGDA